MEKEYSIKTMPGWKWALLLLASLFLGFVMYAFAQATTDFIKAEWAQCLSAIVIAAAMIALYALLVRWFEKHPAKDLPMRRLVPDTLKGLGIGLLFFMVVVLVMSVFGLCEVGSFGTDRPLAIVAAFFLFLVVGTGEEIIFRGILFRWIDEKWGFWTALAVSSLLFGLLHIFQPGATWWSSFAIAVEAGLFLGSAYKYSGTLWLPVGAHWAWNFVEGNVFGFAVSGTDAGASVFHTTVNGPDILTGGAFGPEASVIALVVGLLMSLWFILKVVRGK